MTAESQGSSQAEVNAQAPWFDGVREHIHDVKLCLKNRIRQNFSKIVEPTTSTPNNISCMSKMFHYQLSTLLLVMMTVFAIGSGLPSFFQESLEWH